MLAVLWSVLIVPVAAQPDSTILEREQLTTVDLPGRAVTKRNPNVVTLSGEERLLANVPYTAYIITREEIEENGYLTLTDALRTVPGIFVSPLGSAREGELFMMHGVHGNRQVEFMIDGLAIRPMHTAGMPLSAQMPIRQAERIEVYYGHPGHGAVESYSAGVVNIVLKNSERPVFAQADMSLGDLRFNNIDVLFGGKLGRGDRVLKFSAWGSSTSFNDWNFGFDDPSLATRRNFELGTYDNYYPGTGRYLNNPNFISTDNETVLRRNFPHESRQFGLKLQYQKVEFVVDFRNRSDHAALGLNPLTVAYAVPVNFSSETIARLGFKKKKGTKKFTYGLDFQAMVYGRNPLSSFRPIQDHIAVTYERSLIDSFAVAGVSVTSELRDTVHRRTVRQNLADDRFEFSNTFQFMMHNSFTIKFGRQRLNFGLYNLASGGVSEVSFLRAPGENEGIGSSGPVNLSNNFFSEFDATLPVVSANLYANFNFTFQKLNGSLGITSYFNSITFQQRFTLLPFANFNYRFGENLTIRGGYHRTVWAPTKYFTDYSFVFLEGREVSSPNPLDDSPFNPRFVISHKFELGTYWKVSDQFTLHANAFYSGVDNLLIYDNFEFPTSNTDPNVFLTGYFNHRPIESRILGVQGQLNYRNVASIKGVDTKLSFMFSQGTLSFLDTDQTYDHLDEYPPVLLQWRLLYRGWERWHFAMENILQPPGRSVVRRDEKTIGGVITDGIVRYHLSRNFAVYGKVSNVFKTDYSGISAEESPDAFIYNLQPLLRFRFGLNYNLDVDNSL